uniref:Gustatory receptor n=1 Tax=Culicoides sonorensis TaxID=179676 RepID=A0A336LF89_CULSO
MAQIFGLMPVENVMKHDVLLLQFRLFSMKSIYTSVIFYGLNTYVFIEFFIIAQNWPRLMRHWERVEYLIIKNRGKTFDKKLTHRLWITAIVITICCWMEHIGSFLSTIAYVVKCKPESPYKDFFYGHLEHIFHVIPFNTPLVIIGKYFNIISTFAWNFMDLFVILNSIGMAHTFKIFADFVIHESEKNTNDQFWSKQRQIYQKLVDLVNELDDETCRINLVSYSNNVYFIVVQLLNSIRPLPPLLAFYFWFSLIYLIMRTIAISIFGAEIQIQAKRPLYALRKVKSENWSEELRRFNNELINVTVGITGKKFFFINRSLLLTVAGTIITYELVLVSFRNEEQNSEIVCPRLSHLTHYREQMQVDLLFEIGSKPIHM